MSKKNLAHYLLKFLIDYLNLRNHQSTNYSYRVNSAELVDFNPRNLINTAKFVFLILIKEKM
ncbi:MAG: hypothetical protein CL926_10265 [Deltaproteobacteria bacterium]|nr:hypothetical protein [Deltaproteobacteria bacterium]